MYDLSTFRLERILNNNTKSKTISLLGTFPSQQQQQQQPNPELQQSPDSIAGGDKAIVVLEKTAFTDDDVNTHDDDIGNVEQNNGVVVDQGPQRRYFSLDTQLKQEFINDIYGNFLCYPPPTINSNTFQISFILLSFFLFVEKSFVHIFMPR